MYVTKRILTVTRTVLDIFNYKHLGRFFFSLGSKPVNTDKVREFVLGIKVSVSDFLFINFELDRNGNKIPYALQNNTKCLSGILTQLCYFSWTFFNLLGYYP